MSTYLHIAVAQARAADLRRAAVIAASAPRRPRSRRALRHRCEALAARPQKASAR